MIVNELPPCRILVWNWSDSELNKVSRLFGRQGVPVSHGTPHNYGLTGRQSTDGRTAPEAGVGSFKSVESLLETDYLQVFPQIKMETSQTATTTATMTPDANATATSTAATIKAKNKKQARKRPLPPAVTSRNLAIEKRRRQDMNRIFLDLARCLPRLASTKRLSKNLIVTECLRHLRQQRNMCIAAGRGLRELLSAHNDMIAEVNTLRSQLQIPIQNAPRPPSTAFLSLMDVENQTYGEFPDGFTSPSATETQESQPLAVQRNADASLPGPPIAPDLVDPAQTSAQAYAPNYLDGALDAIPTASEHWQVQMPEHFLAPSNEEVALALDTDWWGLDVSELESEIPQIPPWDEACDDGLQGYSQGAFVPSPSAFL
nr:hypothetical protein CFP56_22002 [Quercus suber]